MMWTKIELIISVSFLFLGLIAPTAYGDGELERFIEHASEEPHDVNQKRLDILERTHAAQVEALAEDDDEENDVGYANIDLEEDAEVAEYFAEFASLEAEANEIDENIEDDSEDEDDQDDEDDGSDLPPEVRIAIERHVQIEIARETVAVEDTQRQLGYSAKAPGIGNNCPSPQVPSQNATCMEIIEEAFEKDFLKIARTKEQKTYKAEAKFEDEIERINQATSKSLSEESIAKRCNWDQAVATQEYNKYRACAKKRVQVVQAKGKILKKAAKKKRKRKIKKQLVIFQKKQKKLLKLRAALLPRCDVCVTPVDPNPESVDPDLSVRF